MSPTPGRKPHQAPFIRSYMPLTRPTAEGRQAASQERREAQSSSLALDIKNNTRRPQYIKEHLAQTSL